MRIRPTAEALLILLIILALFGIMVHNVGYNAGFVDGQAHTRLLMKLASNPALGCVEGDITLADGSRRHIYICVQPAKEEFREHNKHNGSR